MAGGQARMVECLNAAVAAGTTPRSGRVATVTTRAGLISVIDEEDSAWAAGLPWHAHRSGRNHYLCTSYASDLHLSLHSHMLPPRPRAAPPYSRIDVHHIDGDSRNNRRANLQYIAHSTSVALGRRR